MGKYKLKYVFIICIGFFVLYWLLKFINIDMLWLSMFGIFIILLFICAISIAVKYQKVKIIVFATLLLIAHSFMLFVNQSIFEVEQVTNIEHKTHKGLVYSISIERLGYDISLLCNKDMYNIAELNSDYKFIYKYSIVFPNYGKLIQLKPIDP